MHRKPWATPAGAKDLEGPSEFNAVVGNELKMARLDLPLGNARIQAKHRAVFELYVSMYLCS